MRDLPGPDSPALPRPKAAAERPGLGEFLRMLAEEGGRDAIVVTDSGRHQMIVRRDHRVFSAGGLLVPTDLQSMGFGIPAAIGAKLAAPHRPVVAIVGDGGFRLTALELLVAQREGVPILTVVVNDGELGLIADEQRKAYGRACDTRVSIPELSLLARSLGLPVLGMAGGRRDALEGVLRGEGAGVLEVGVEEEERVPPRSTAAMLWRRAAQAGLRRITPRRLRRLAVALRTGGGRPGSES